MCQIWWGRHWHTLVALAVQSVSVFVCLPTSPAFSPSPPLRPGGEAGQQMAGPYPSAGDEWRMMSSLVWQAPVRACTKEASRVWGRTVGLLLILESIWHLLKWRELDLCPGWYCLTPHSGLERSNKTESPREQSCIFPSCAESGDWLLEINTDPVIPTAQFKSGSILVSMVKNYSLILPVNGRVCELVYQMCTNFCLSEYLLMINLCPLHLPLLVVPEDNTICTPTARDSYERLSLAGPALPPGFPSPFLFPDGLSSIETLLTNIQV